jgi:hypothetical protein
MELCEWSQTLLGIHKFYWGYIYIYINLTTKWNQKQLKWMSCDIQPHKLYIPWHLQQTNKQTNTNPERKCSRNSRPPTSWENKELHYDHLFALYPKYNIASCAPKPILRGPQGICCGIQALKVQTINLIASPPKFAANLSQIGFL